MGCLTCGSGAVADGLGIQRARDQCASGSDALMRTLLRFSNVVWTAPTWASPSSAARASTPSRLRREPAPGPHGCSRRPGWMRELDNFPGRSSAGDLPNEIKTLWPCGASLAGLSRTGAWVRPRWAPHVDYGRIARQIGVVIRLSGGYVQRGRGTHTDRRASRGRTTRHTRGAGRS
jgi:hypothetical protein